MDLKICSKLEGAYPGDILPQDVFTYVVMEAIELRDRIKRHKLHNRLTLDVHFKGGRTNMVVHTKIDIEFPDIGKFPTREHVLEMQFSTIQSDFPRALPARGVYADEIMREVGDSVMQFQKVVNEKIGSVVSTFAK